MGRAEQTTRRTILAAMASVLPTSALLTVGAWGKEEVSLDWPDDRPPTSGVLRVVLRLPEGHKLPASTRVSVRIADNWENTRRRSELIYEKEVKTGQSYAIQVAANEYLTIERTVYMDSSLVAAQVFLVPNGWPYYFMGGIEIPFEPRPQLAGVGLGRSITSVDLAKLATLADKAGFRRVTKDPGTGRDLDDVNGSVLYFEPKQRDVLLFSFDKDAAAPPVTALRLRDQALAHRTAVSAEPVLQLRGLFAAYDGRVGSPAKLGTGRVRIVDSQYLIRFGKTVTESEVRKYAISLGATLLRASDAEFWLIDFDDPQNLGRHLDVIAQQVKSGSLSSGEPNLLVQFAAHGLGYLRRMMCLLSSDKDPYEQCQGFLSRQRVEQAWCYIEQYVPGSRYGSSQIRVATIDVGPMTFDTSTGFSSHPDVNENRMDYCYNVEAEYGAPCSGSTPPLAERDPHGMATYGLISAKPDNEHGVTGIAPNATHIAVEAVSIIYDSARYSETLRWVGGLRSIPPCGRFDLQNPPPVMKPADIINCSHGLEGDPAPQAVKDALKDLACQGRGGRGTIIVYSAGNLNEPILTQDEMATNLHTIGVANTDIVGGNEVRWIDANNSNRGSNFSHWIGLCANGQRAPSLFPDPNMAGPVCDGLSAEEVAGVFLHQGTSAAAPMVSAAAALVLTINPRLNWKQVRAILCASAEKIDCGNSDPDGNGQWRLRASGSAAPQPCSGLPRGLDWFSDWYGYGRLDVYEAVKLAHALTEVLPPCNALLQPPSSCSP